MFQGEGYDCARDSFNGDGLWSNVAGQREWVESQLLEGLTLGLPPQLNSVILSCSCLLNFALIQVSCVCMVELGRSAEIWQRGTYTLMDILYVMLAGPRRMLLLLVGGQTAFTCNI